MSIESQKSIMDWADQTFGPVSDPLQSALRADQEMKEFRGRLNEALGQEQGEALRDHFSYLCAEAADIVICLYRMASVMGADLGQEIDQKMKINRLRQWVSDGTGHGQHVRGQLREDSDGQTHLVPRR